MENPGTASKNKKERGFVVVCSTIFGVELERGIEVGDNGAINNNLGVSIEGKVSNHEWGVNPTTGKYIRIEEENGKKVQKEGNQKIMKKEEQSRNRTEKDMGR